MSLSSSFHLFFTSTLCILIKHFLKERIRVERRVRGERKVREGEGNGREVGKGRGRVRGERKVREGGG